MPFLLFKLQIITSRLFTGNWNPLWSIQFKYTQEVLHGPTPPTSLISSPVLPLLCQGKLWKTLRWAKKIAGSPSNGRLDICLVPFQGTWFYRSLHHSLAWTELFHNLVNCRNVIIGQMILVHRDAKGLYLLEMPLIPTEEASFTLANPPQHYWVPLYACSLDSPLNSLSHLTGSLIN